MEATHEDRMALADLIGFTRQSLEAEDRAYSPATRKQMEDSAKRAESMMDRFYTAH